MKKTNGQRPRTARVSEPWVNRHESTDLASAAAHRDVAVLLKNARHLTKQELLLRDADEHRAKVGEPIGW